MAHNRAVPVSIYALCVFVCVELSVCVLILHIYCILCCISGRPSAPKGASWRISARWRCPPCPCRATAMPGGVKASASLKALPRYQEIKTYTVAHSCTEF